MGFKSILLRNYDHVSIHQGFVSIHVSIHQGFVSIHVWLEILKMGKMLEMIRLIHEMNCKVKILIKFYNFFIGLNSPSTSRQAHKGKGKAI